MTSAFVPAVATSTVVTDPVVPQETAARPISASPAAAPDLTEPTPPVMIAPPKENL
jgi:hypothetical protein